MPLERNVLRFAKLTKNAFTPSCATENTAAFYLKSPYTCFVPAHGKELVNTDLQLTPPPETYCRIEPISLFLF